MPQTPRRAANVHPVSRGCSYIYLEQCWGKVESWKTKAKEAREEKFLAYESEWQTLETEAP